MAHTVEFGNDQLQSLLRQAVERGYCSWTTFASFDKTGAGEISSKLFRLGLEEAGIDLQPALVSRLFAAISNGRPIIVLEDFERFISTPLQDETKSVKSDEHQEQNRRLKSNKTTKDLNNQLESAAPINDDADGAGDLVQQLLEGNVGVDDVVEAFQHDHCLVLDGAAAMQYKILGPERIHDNKPVQSIVVLPDVMDTISRMEAFFLPILELANQEQSVVHLQVLLMQYPGQFDTTGEFPSISDLEMPHDVFLSKCVLSMLVNLAQDGLWGMEHQQARLSSAASESSTEQGDQNSDADSSEEGGGNTARKDVDVPVFSPWIILGSGIGGHISTHLLSVEATSPVYRHVFYNLQCAVYINSFAVMDPTLDLFAEQLLSWEGSLDEQQLMRILFSRDFIISKTQGQVIQQFFSDRQQLSHRGVSKSTVRSLLEGMATYTDLRPGMANHHWPCILVKATEDSIVNAGHVKDYTSEFGPAALKRVIAHCLEVGPEDRVVGKQSNGSVGQGDDPDHEYSDEQLLAHERTCWSASPRYCVQWLKSGHEVLTERDEYLQAFVGKLLEQVTKSHCLLQGRSGSRFGSSDEENAIVPGESLAAMFANLTSKMESKETDQAPEGLLEREKPDVENEGDEGPPGQEFETKGAEGKTPDESADENSQENTEVENQVNERSRKARSNVDIKHNAKSTYEMMQREEEERKQMGVEDDFSRDLRLQLRKEERWEEQVAISNERIQRLRKERLRREQDPWMNIGNENGAFSDSRMSQAPSMQEDLGLAQNSGDLVAPLGSGVARLRMDILRIRSKRKSLVYQVQQIQQRLKDTNQKLHDAEGQLKELSRASYRLQKKRAAVLSPTKRRVRKTNQGNSNNAQRIMDAANEMKFELQVLDGRIKEEEKRVDEFKQKQTMTQKKMAALNTNIQEIAIIYGSKIEELQSSHERLLQQHQQTIRELQASRRERDDALFRKAETLRQQYQLQVRLEEVTAEEKRIKNWTGKHIDSDVWQKGVKQRIRLTDLKSYLAKESSTGREVLMALHTRLEARSDELERLCQRIFSLQSEEINLLEQLKVTRELKVLVKQGSSAVNDPDGEGENGGNENKQVTSIVDSAVDGERELCEIVRFKHPDARSPEEQLWAYYDQRMNPDLYASSIDEAESHMEAYPQNVLAEELHSEVLSVAALKRICTLPEGINVAVAFLRNSTEVEAHRLIQKYTFGRGEEELRQLDRNVHRIQLIEEQEKFPSRGPRQNTCVFRSLEAALERGRAGEIERQMQVYIETDQVEQVFGESGLLLECGDGKIFEFSVNETDMFGELWASVVFKGSFQARGYILGRISASMFKVVEGDEEEIEATGDSNSSLRPTGWSPYNKVSICSPERLGQIIITHSPFQSDMPVHSGRYQVVVGAASKTNVSIAVYGRVIQKVGHVIRDEVERIKVLIQRNKELVSDISELSTSLRLAERKLSLVMKLEDEVKHQCNELEENMATLAKSLQEAQENELDEYEDELQDPEAISRALVTLEAKFSSAVAIAASRKQESVDISKAIERMNEIKVRLKTELQNNRDIVYRNKETIPPLMQLIHGKVNTNEDTQNGVTSEKPANELLTRGTSNGVTSSIWATNGDDLDLEQVMNMTPAQRIRRQHAKGIPITPEEENWLNLDRILNPELHAQLGNGLSALQDNARIAEEDELDDEETKRRKAKEAEKAKTLNYMIDNNLESGLSADSKKVSIDFTREELIRCLTVDLQELNKEEHAVRKLLVKYHDQVRKPIEYQDVGMNLLDRLKEAEPDSLLVEFTPQERWWMIHDATVHPENFTSDSVQEKLVALVVNSASGGSGKPKEQDDGQPVSAAAKARRERNTQERERRDPYLTREELLAIFASKQFDPDVAMAEHLPKAVGANEEEEVDTSMNEMISEMEQEMANVNVEGSDIDLTGAKEKYFSIVGQPESQAQGTLRQFASTLERLSLSEDVASRNKEKWTFFSSSKNATQSTDSVVGDVDARCREILREIDRLQACSKRFVDSKVLHGTLQRFPTTVLMTELGRELDRQLRGQVHERESGILAKFRNVGGATGDFMGEESGSDYDSDEIGPEEAQESKEESRVSTERKENAKLPPALADDEENPLYCRSCLHVPCQWKPAVNMEEVIERLRLVQAELEVIRQLDPSVKFVDSEQALSVVRGGNSRMYRRDLMDELNREIVGLKRQERIFKVDKELHDAYANTSDFMETRALHGYPQMQWTMNVISALEEERNRVLADEMAGEIISDVLEWMLDGWMFGERDEFIPEIQPEGRKRTRVDDEGNLIAIKDVAEITEVALVRSVAKRMKKEKSELDHQLDETESTLKFGLFMISLMYFRAMTLLKKSADSVSGKTSFKNSVGVAKAGNNLITPERQKMILEQELAEQRTRRIQAAMQKAQNGMARKLNRLEKEKQMARAKLREKLLKVTRETKASTTIQKVVRGHLGRIAMSKFALRAKEMVEQKKLEYAAVIAIQRMYRGFQARCLAKDRFAEIAAFIAKLREDEAAEEEREYWRRHYIRRWARDTRQFVSSAPDKVRSTLPFSLGASNNPKTSANREKEKEKVAKQVRMSKEKAAKRKQMKDQARKRYEDKRKSAKQFSSELTKRLSRKLSNQLGGNSNSSSISKIAPAS